MSTHSVAEAKNSFSALIDRAVAGEEVVITRHGRPVVELKAVTRVAARGITPADLDWLAERRNTRGSLSTDAGTLVSRIRDEDWR